MPFQSDERKTTFLIVDDDPAYSLFWKEALCSKFPVADVIMTDGYEALLLIGERKPHFPLLDLRCPNSTGSGVFTLRQRNKDQG